MGIGTRITDLELSKRGDLDGELRRAERLDTESSHVSLHSYPVRRRSQNVHRCARHEKSLPHRRMVERFDYTFVLGCPSTTREVSQLRWRR